MKNTMNNVNIQGMGNIQDLKEIMNVYTSSFTEGFIQMLENYNTPLQEFHEVENTIKPKVVNKPKSKPKTKNKGFDKLKNTVLKKQLQNCNSVRYDSKKHIKVKDLNYKSIYELDKRSYKLWEKYFEKNQVYLNGDVTTSKLSPKILFDKSKSNLLSKKGTLSDK